VWQRAPPTFFEESRQRTCLGQDFLRILLSNLAKTVETRLRLKQQRFFNAKLDNKMLNLVTGVRASACL